MRMHNTCLGLSVYICMFGVFWEFLILRSQQKLSLESFSKPRSEDFMENRILEFSENLKTYIFFAAVKLQMFFKLSLLPQYHI